MKERVDVQGLAVEQVPRNLRERLERDRASMERRLADINRALSLLDRNPDTEELMNLIS